jgi:DNA-binding CsgD family transcriptional regulator
MGSPKKNWREQVFGPERARNIKSQLFVLLRDELGLGKQPKVARLLVDEITNVLNDSLLDISCLKPGQLLTLAPEIGQGPSWHAKRLEDKKMKAVILDLLDPDDIEALAKGEPLPDVRGQRMVRLVKQAFEQGTTLTACQLALMTGISPGSVSNSLNAYMKSHDTILPMRGIIEDCSPAVSHKALIIARHLQGESTSEIARATDHTPHSVERYVRRFEQVRELVKYLDKSPEPETIARILGCSRKLVETYLSLLREHSPSS